MGRKRKSGEHLPRYVYRHGGWYVWRPYVDGRLQSPVQLVRLDRPVSEVWAAWEAVREGAHRPTLRRLMQRYLYEHKRLAPRTRKDYQAYARILGEAPLAGGRCFGDVHPDDVEPRHIRAYLDRHADTPTAADRRIQFLKAAYSWAFERGRVAGNPCTGVRLHNPPARDRYVTDAEYEAVLGLARQRAAAGRSPYLWIMIELAYLCRARCGEIRAMRRQDVAGDSLEWRRTKGSRHEHTRITPRLKRAIDAAKRLDSDILSPWLVHRRGQRIGKNAFDSAWQRLIRDALDAGLIAERFTFHDLKAKGISDHADHASGHRSDRQRLDYIRKPDDVEATR